MLAVVLKGVVDRAGIDPKTVGDIVVGRVMGSSGQGTLIAPKTGSHFPLH